jgi:hypothetical protein
MELTDKEKQFLDTMGREPILRIMLNSEEIKIANKLYKMGLIQKGKSDVAIRRPGRNVAQARNYRPVIIDEVFLEGDNHIRLFFYESEIHKQQGRNFRPLGVIIPIAELPQLRRDKLLNKLLNK